MPSPLVCEVRQLIRARTDEGIPLTMPERALLLATLSPPRRAGGDVVDELEAAIAHARRVLLEEPHRDADRAATDTRKAAARRLLAAARAVLDYAPALDHDPTANLDTIPADPRRKRADVDG